jgi:hypothetical protein
MIIGRIIIGLLFGAAVFGVLSPLAPLNVLGAIAVFVFTVSNGGGDSDKRAPILGE